MKIQVSLVILTLLFPTIKSRVVDQNDHVFEEVRVGLVVDLGSIEGKILETAFTLALSDFYRINNGYRTRVSVLARDSQGDPLLANIAARNLLKKAKVEVIVCVRSLQEAKPLAMISKKSKVLLISALESNSLSLNKYDNFIQFTHDTTSEAKGIASLIHDFRWKSIVVIYEDVDDWRESLQTFVENFQGKGINIARFASFALPLGENHMVNQLKELKDPGPTVFVVHMSEILASRLFRCVVKLGMMKQGYVWILTARTMNSFRYPDKSVQGVVGFRSYIPISKEVENFTLRMRKLMGGDKETKSFNSVVVSAHAHDIACILATTVEKISLRGRATRSDGFNRTKHDASAYAQASLNALDLLNAITQSGFKGFTGEIKINGNKFLSETFEIVNVVGKKKRRVGLWSSGSFSKKRRIVWPGEYVKIPRHRLLAENGEKKLLRVLVTAGNRVPSLLSVRFDPEIGVNTVTGFCAEVFKTCIAPFKYELEFIPYNGSYDNLAYLLFTQKNKYDAAIGDITITSNRSSYVDFTLPFTDIGIGALTLKKKSQSMWNFFDPFEKSLWLASGAFFILTGIVVWLVERPVNPEFQGSWGQQLSIMLWFGFSTIVFAHREKLQKMSSKFLVIVWVFVVLILTSSYSANLASTKTISRIQLNNHKVFGPSIIKSMRPKTTNAIEAYAQVLQDGTLSYVIDEIPYLNILIGQYPDVFAMTDREAITNGFGFMFQKGAGLAPKVSREIAKLRSLGILEDMEKRWSRERDSLNVHSNTYDNDASNRFTFHELGGLFIIAAVSHTLVLFIHLIHMRREILRVFSESRLLAKVQSLANFCR